MDWTSFLGGGGGGGGPSSSAQSGVSFGPTGTNSLIMVAIGAVVLLLVVSLLLKK